MATQGANISLVAKTVVTCIKRMYEKLSNNPMPK